MRMMKDSGIEWIGKIPDNWNTPPLKSRYTFGKGLSITKADLSEEIVRYNGFDRVKSELPVMETTVGGLKFTSLRERAVEEYLLENK